MWRQPAAGLPDACLPDPCSPTHAAGCTALHAAAAGGREKSIEALLAAGCKQDIASTLKRTALHIACQKGFEEVAVLLVAGGADPYGSPAGGDSPMVMLRRCGEGRSRRVASVLGAVVTPPPAQG